MMGMQIGSRSDDDFDVFGAIDSYRIPLKQRTETLRRIKQVVDEPGTLDDYKVDRIRKLIADLPVGWDSD
jgi:hypothetical protein